MGARAINDCERKNSNASQQKRNDLAMKEISAQKLCAGTVSGCDTQGGRAL
jgi:hypothetical protein